MHAAGNDSDDESDGLAYGDYTIDTDSEHVCDRIVCDRISNGIGRLVNFCKARLSTANYRISGQVSLSDIVMPQMRMRASVPEISLQFHQLVLRSPAVKPSSARTKHSMDGAHAQQARRYRGTEARYIDLPDRIGWPKRGARLRRRLLTTRTR